MASTLPGAADVAATVVRINTGGPGHVVDGVEWSGCSVVDDCSGWVSGGDARTDGGTVSGAVAPASEAIYQSAWTGGQSQGVPVGGTAFTFDVPLTSGEYVLRLHFAEHEKDGPGQRVFDVNIEGGTKELTSFDVYAAAGGMGVAVVRQFPVSIADGVATIGFITQTGDPIVSAIEIRPDDGPASEPSTRLFSWRPVAPSPVARFEAQSAAVGGKLYVFGGFGTSKPLEASSRSDVYDPVRNTWTRLADMPEAVTHAATAVDGRSVFLIGGYVGAYPGRASEGVWVYRVDNDTWTAGPALPAARAGGASAVLDNRLHFFAGTDRDGIDRGEHWALRLDIEGAVWQRFGNLFPNPRNHLGGVAVAGRIYGIGGQHRRDESAGNQAEVDAWDPVTETWARVADLPAPRGHISGSSLVHGGRIVVIGGALNGKKAAPDVAMYDPGEDAWLRLPPLPSGRNSPAAAVLGEQIVVTAGWQLTATTSSWDGVLTGSWERGRAMPVALGEVAGGVAAGNLYLVGQGSGATLGYNLSTGRWSTSTALARRAYKGHHHAAEIVAGKLYLFGGLGSGSGGRVQIYNPVTNSWSLGPAMPFAAGASSSALIRGQVYVAGGIIGSATTDRLARFHPASGTWTSLAPMPHGRNHAAAATDGSRLFVFGGRGPGSGDSNTVANGFDTVQVYDPATDSWTSSLDAGSTLRPLPQPRGGMGRAVYLGGEFLVFGGETLDGVGATDAGVYDRVDIYDPVANRWRRGAPMPTARHGIHPLVRSGRVHLAGGGIRAGASASRVFEIYAPGT
ncbi:MAG: malectin domain-containing carbohydrate-binding protein [Actinomycetota bacterium]|nr:malectin domain-containing carbohydrate-binding protein [Actinomycetota bacterium]